MLLSTNKSRKFYIPASLFVVAGWFWLFFAMRGSGGTVCVFKNITGWPCPACGSTGGVMQLLHGEFYSALLLNPLSYLLAVGLVVLPLWLLSDMVRGRSSLYKAVVWFDGVVRRRPFLLVVILFVVVVNWVMLLKFVWTSN
jgi:hypothetical protein